MKRSDTTLPFSWSGRSLLLSALIAAAMPAAAQVNVTATAGTVGPVSYTTLKSAFDAINAGTHQAAVTVVVAGNTTETAAAVLNASGAGSASYTSVLIRPAASTSPTVTGLIPSGALIKLNGASNVTIDGSNNGSTSRDLTLINTAPTDPKVVWMGSTGTAISGDTLKNCIISGGSNDFTLGQAVCIATSGSATGSGLFNNITIRNNSIRKAFYGVYARASSTGTNGSGLLITGNDLTASGADAIGKAGVMIQGVNGATISDNAIGNFTGGSNEDDYGVWLNSNCRNITVAGNTIGNIHYTGGNDYAPAGVYVETNVAAASIEIRDNSISNLSSNGDWIPAGIWVYGTSGGMTITRNRISDLKNTFASGYGAVGILLESSASGSGSAIATTNNFVSDVAAAGTNQTDITDNGYGIAIAEDGPNHQVHHNTVWLNTNQTFTGANRAAAMLITDWVITPSCINLRNNLFINTQTVGNANSRYALLCTADNDVFSAINYNDYFATSTNLSSRGTNASIRHTIAEIQANFGGNGSSVSLEPAFVSATDLHLQQTAANGGLNNTGVTIAAVAADIDAQPRATPPDMGADEFDICTVTVTAGADPVNASVCAPANATFTASATNATSYQWQVNSGSGFANISDGSQYSGAGTTTLTVVAPAANMHGYSYRLVSGTTPLCPTVSSAPATLSVGQLPAVAITASAPLSQCIGGSVPLNATPVVAGYLYQWQRNGSDLPGATSAGYAATSTGSYTVVVTNSAGGCGAVTAAAVNVEFGPGPVAAITTAGNPAFCAGGSVALSAGNVAGLTYQWQRNGIDLPGATTNTYTASSPGSYAVLVTAGPGCANLSAPLAITENPLPPALITPAGSTAFCAGSSVTLSANTGTGLAYQWRQGSSNIAGAVNSTHAASSAGTYSLKVTNTLTGCEQTSPEVVVSENPLPDANITPASPAAICQGDSSLLTANAGAGLSYQWKLNNASIGGATAGTFHAKAAGSYTLLVTDANGCQKTSAPAGLTVNPLPPSYITYNSPLSFCEGSAVVLRANGDAGLTYQWQRNGSALAGQTGSNIVAAQTGHYSVVTRNGFSCVRASDSVQVTVHARPQPVITAVNFMLHAGAGYAQYQWFRNNSAIAGATDSMYAVAQNGVYSVRVVDSNGCDNSSPAVSISTVAVQAVAAGESGIRLYPNPAQDVATVESNGTARISEVLVLNSLGATVQRIAADSSSKVSLRLGHLAAGMYTLRIQLTDGRASLQKLQLLHY